MADKRLSAASFAFDAKAFDLEAWLQHVAPEEPCFIYERASTRTRAPLRSFIGFGHPATGAVAAGADPFGGLRAAIATAASSPSGPQAVFAFLSYEALTGSELGADTPRQLFLRPDILVDLDHEAGTASLTGNGAASEAVRRSFSSAGPPSSAADATPADDGDGAVPAWTQAPTQAEFTAKILALKREIAGGGTVVGAALSVVLSGALDVAPLRAYRALRRINPSTCMFFVRDGAFALWGATSLPVFRTEGRQIVAETDGATRRVAPGGTAPWVPDSKEIAEYDLVVSALREDLAGIIEDGSLHFIADREARQYFNLQHLFAEVEARWRAASMPSRRCSA